MYKMGILMNAVKKIPTWIDGNNAKRRKQSEHNEKRWDRHSEIGEFFNTRFEKNKKTWTLQLGESTCLIIYTSHLLNNRRSVNEFEISVIVTEKIMMQIR